MQKHQLIISKPCALCSASLAEKWIWFCTMYTGYPAATHYSDNSPQPCENQHDRRQYLCRYWQVTFSLDRENPLATHS